MGKLLPGHFALTALFIFFLLRVYNQYHDHNNYTTSKHTTKKITYNDKKNKSVLKNCHLTAVILYEVSNYVHE